MYQFPKGFLWGSSTSAPQTEGRLAQDGKGDNLWRITERGSEPNRFYQGQGPENIDFYEHWEEDVASYLKLVTPPFGPLSSGRIFPEGRGEINQAALISTAVSLKDKGKRDSPLGVTLIILIYRWLFDQEMVGKENKETAWCIPRIARFVSRPMGIWSTSGSPLMNPLSLEFGLFL